MGKRQVRHPVTGDWVDAEIIQGEPEAAVDPKQIDQRSDGSIRRAGAGTRERKSIFDEKNRDRPLTRAEYLNLRASEEFARREQTLLRRIWRWMRGWPRVVNINAGMADAHARSLDAIRRALALKQQQEDDAEQVRALKR